MASAVQVGDLAADGHHLAVDEPILGATRRRAGQHGFVQEEALVEDARCTATVPSQQPEVRSRRGTVGEAAPDVVGGGEGGVEVAALESLAEVEPGRNPWRSLSGRPVRRRRARPTHAEPIVGSPRRTRKTDVQGVRGRPIHAALVEKPPVALLAQRQRLADQAQPPGGIARAWRSSVARACWS